MIQPETAIIILTLILVVLLRVLRRYFVLFWLAALPGIVLHEHLPAHSPSLAIGQEGVKRAAGSSLMSLWAYIGV